MVIVIGSVLVGYVAFASFLVDQLVWISVLLALLLLAIVLVDEFIGGTLRDQTRIATTLQANTGLRRRSLAQIGVLATGIARVLLILIAGMAALAPWGIESADLLSSLRAAFVGVQGWRRHDLAVGHRYCGPDLRPWLHGYTCGAALAQHDLPARHRP